MSQLSPPRSGSKTPTSRVAIVIGAALLTSGLASAWVGGCAASASPTRVGAPADHVPTAAPTGSTGSDVVVPAVSAASAAARAPSSLLTLTDLGGIQGFALPLADERFDPALVAVPRGPSPSPTAPRPLVVATHGAEDDVAAFCGVVAAAVADRAFVLCPRGKRVDRRDPPDRARYFYENHLRLAEELADALAAAQTAFGASLDASRAVYLGYSQGAMMGALVLAKDGARFPRTVSIEGVYGSGQWTVDMGARYRKAGGERVLFLCGGSVCAEKARRAAAALGQGGSTLRTRIVQSGGGHTYAGSMAEALNRELGWIFDGDARFHAP
jgi:predicted esterase